MPAPFPLRRDLAALRRQRFDLLVIGGGIYGAWTACDAAARGLSVALVEKDDWGAGTSSASSKLIHGGLRYLEHFEFGLVRHSLAERRVLTHIAPHLVRPLRFIVPVHRGARVGMFVLGAGLTLYDALSGFNQPVARHRRFSATRLAQRLPFLRREDLRGGYSYGDCQEDDARMTLTVVAAAQANGAVCANRVEALGLHRDNGRARGAELRDVFSGERFDIDAGAVVAASGPWSRQLFGDAAPRMKLVKGVHLLLPAIPGCDDAFLLTAPQDGRVFFVIPWYGRTLVGTTESEVSGPEEVVVTAADRRYLLDAVNAVLPGLRWSDDDVIAAFAGARTLQADDAENLSAVTREFELLEPLGNVLLPLGGKYTTARSDAVGIVDRVQQCLGREPTPSRTATQPLPGAPSEPMAAWLPSAVARLQALGVDDAAARTAALRHGTRIERIADLIGECGAWRERLYPAAPFLIAEAVLACRDEMAASTDDVLRRRLPLRLLAGARALRDAGVDGVVDALLKDAAAR
jgi:glycerol-3-phosphate dehydrogenase